MIAANIKKMVHLVLDEDAAHRDITTRSLIPKNQVSQAYLLAKQNIILCGMPIVLETFRQMDSRVRIKNSLKEGAKVNRGGRIAEITGKTRALLSGERVALNFLQHLCAIANVNRQFVKH